MSGSGIGARVDGGRDGGRDVGRQELEPQRAGLRNALNMMVAELLGDLLEDAALVGLEEVIKIAQEDLGAPRLGGGQAREPANVAPRVAHGQGHERIGRNDLVRDGLMDRDGVVISLEAQERHRHRGHIKVTGAISVVVPDRVVAKELSGEAVVELVNSF